MAQYPAYFDNAEMLRTESQSANSTNPRTQPFDAGSLEDKEMIVDSDETEVLDYSDQSDAENRLSQRGASRHRGKGPFGIQDLPRELRQNIYRYVVKLDAPLAMRRGQFRCNMPACHNRRDVDLAKHQEQRAWVFGFIKTSSTIYPDARAAFFDVNRLTLHRAKLREHFGTAPWIFRTDSDKMFNKLKSRVDFLSFKHVEIRVFLSWSSVFDLDMPPHPSVNDLRNFLLDQPAIVSATLQKHTLSAAQQCGVWQVTINRFVLYQSQMFPHLRTFTVDLEMHPPLLNSMAQIAVDHCGLTLRIKIWMMTELSTDSSRVDAYVGWCSTKRLGNRRSILAALGLMQGIHRIEVNRRWTVECVSKNPEGESNTHVHRLEQRLQFSKFEDFLEFGGNDLDAFQIMGLEQLGIRWEDVTAIREDAPDGCGEYRLVNSRNVSLPASQGHSNN